MWFRKCSVGLAIPPQSAVLADLKVDANIARTTRTAIIKLKSHCVASNPITDQFFLLSFFFIKFELFFHGPLFFQLYLRCRRFIVSNQEMMHGSSYASFPARYYPSLLYLATCPTYRHFILGLYCRTSVVLDFFPVNALHHNQNNLCIFLVFRRLCSIAFW